MFDLFFLEAPDYNLSTRQKHISAVSFQFAKFAGKPVTIAIQLSLVKEFRRQ
ncbi:MAG TPA: hypothetical protein VI279_15045 [Rhodocyclaceae bacterium]|jgi:hypothetical protein